MAKVDLLVIGAGTAGLMAAIHAARAGAHVLLVEAADRVGGTLHLSAGHMSAAGSRLQAEKGIHDTPDAHFADVMRINRNSANPALVRLAVDHAVDTLHWLLDEGLEVLPEHPIFYKGHEPYTTPRTCWGPDNGRSILKVLKQALDAEIEAGRVTLWLDTRLAALRTDDGLPVPGGQIPGGAVTGARVLHKCEMVDVEAAAVLLATGGYAASDRMFAELNPGVPLHGGAWPQSRGEGLAAARALGADVAHRGSYLPIFACVEHPGMPGGYSAATITNPLVRPPWELFLNDDGQRFFAEDQPSCDQREHALAAQPGMSFWAVYDAAIRAEAPPFFLTPELEARFGHSPDYVVADSLEALALATGMDAAGLVATVSAYNAAQQSGVHDPLGRTHRPAPVLQPPFYAVRHYSWSILGFAGLTVDASLRVVRADGTPIARLYAAGEVLGFGQTSGTAFCSGMSLTPALSFGRLLGQRLGAKLAES